MLVFLLLCFLLLSGCSATTNEEVSQDQVPAARIVLTGQTRSYESEPNTQVIKVDGKFLLPGLIDGHVHYLG